MTIVLLAFLAVFGAAVGVFIGAGNHAGVAGAILPGLIVGLLLSTPFMRGGDWSSTALLVVCALAGSVAINYVSDNNGLKHFCREQTKLVIRLGSYKLGQKSDPSQ